MLYLAKDLNKISDDDFKLLFAMSEEVSKMLSGLNKVFVEFLKSATKNNYCNFM